MNVTGMDGNTFFVVDFGKILDREQAKQAVTLGRVGDAMRGAAKNVTRLFREAQADARRNKKRGSDYVDYDNVIAAANTALEVTREAVSSVAPKHVAMLAIDKGIDAIDGEYGGDEEFAAAHVQLVQQVGYLLPTTCCREK